MTELAVPSYRIDRELGRGGMATVYLAQDLRHERKVAIKVLRPELSAAIGTERFLREIRTLASIQHPHVLGLIDSGQVDGMPYYVMPFVDGESLRDRLMRERQPPIPVALRIAGQVAGALEYAHRRGVIHRDLKPENILLHEGEALLADFGIALALKEAGGPRLTETGLSLGTPHYMSPEQATGDRALDARTDVWSLGAVVYEMLAGEPPFPGATAQAVVARLVTERPTPLRMIRDTVPAAVERAVGKALAKVPADRYPTVEAFAAALADDRAGSKTPLTGGIRAGHILVAFVLLVLGGAAAFTLRSRTPAAPSPIRQQITYSGRIDYPILSPDAAHVAYVEHRDCGEAERCPADIVVQEAFPGGSRRVVGSVHQGNVWEWSPDGRRLLVADAEGGAVLNGVLTVLSGEFQPLGARQAVWTGSPDTMLTWLFGARNERVWMTSVTAADLAPVDSFAFGPTWLVNGIRVSPDGRWLAIQHTRRNALYPSLSIVDRSGRVRDTLPRADGVVGWEASSERLYFRTWDPGVRSESNVLRQRIDRTTGRRVGEPVRLGRFRASSMHVAGNALVLDEAGPAEATVWALERGSPDREWKSRVARRTTARGSAVVSRNGARIAYFTLRETEDTVLLRLEILAFTADSMLGEVTLPDVRWFQISPDGTRADFVFRSPRTPVKVVDLRTGSRRDLSPPPGAGTMHWTADGRLLWLPDDPGEILVLDSAWTVKRRIPWDERVGAPAYAMAAPRGAEMAVVTARPAGDTLSLGVYRVPLDSGPPVAIAAAVPVQAWSIADLPVWVNDGWIYIPLRDPGKGGRVARIRVTDGRLEDLGPPPKSGGVLEAFTMDRDGRRAVEWIANQSRDLVVIRNFDPEAASGTSR